MPLSAGQSLELHKLESRSDQFQFWKSPRTGSGSDIMAAPAHLEELKNILTNLKINFEVMVDDVQT